MINEADYRTDSAEEVLYGMRAKYGKDILRRFYKECRDADARGEIKLARGKGPNRDQYVQLMSRAAGEDVLPYFKKWNGFEAAK